MEGCEGSIIRNPSMLLRLERWASSSADDGRLFFSNPTSHWSVIRTNMSLHISEDNGATWTLESVIDPGPSAYSALVTLQNGSVAILYERAPPPPKLVFVPQSISFTIAWSP